MACIEKIYSISALVGNGTCNANCSFCSGKYLRPEAKENLNYYKNLESAIKLCARYGGWSLSLTSSGEPTCDPDALTKALQVYYKCSKEGAYFPNVNLFTNGILFADKNFCWKYLPAWKSFGLNNIAISIHDVDEIENAKIYGIKKYPELKTIFERIKNAGLVIRANLMLSKFTISNLEDFKHTVRQLFELNVDTVSSWVIRNDNDEIDYELSPNKEELDKIENWILEQNTYRIKFLREKERIKYENKEKLTLFPDGTLSNTWCNN